MSLKIILYLLCANIFLQAAINTHYRQMLELTCQVANTFKQYGVVKGDRVAVYMPMTPLLAAVMLACARIGAVHSVVFAGFSAEALRSRILDGEYFINNATVW